MSDRPPLGVRVDKDVRDRFREYTYEHKGRIRGEMGRLVERAMREYMDNGRLARIEAEMRIIKQQHHEILEILKNESHPATSEDQSAHTLTNVDTDTDTNASREEKLSSLNPQIRPRIESTLENLTEGSVSQTDLEQAIIQAGYTDSRTIKKYIRVLESAGILLPDPNAPTDDNKWVIGATKFAMRCEQEIELTPVGVDSLVGDLEKKGRLSEKDYREALPENFCEDGELKLDQIE